jgi:2-oxoglutarate dehydrogenase E2 component (dihydrolipoamide succinyltransferase)
MIIEIKVPSPGESISEVQIAHWIKKDGEFVEKDEEIAEIDSDKATLTLSAEANGILKILVQEGETVAVGSVVCTIDSSADAATGSSDKKNNVENKVQAKQKEIVADENKSKEEKKIKEPVSNSEPAVANYAKGVPSVAAEKIMKENNLTNTNVKATGKGGRITKSDVVEALNKPVSPTTAAKSSARNERREKMTMLRKKVAERLVAVKQQTAMLTTFNEVDMSAIMDIRKKYKETFKEKHGIGLGFMSFFTKAVCEALKAFPAVNARIEGDEIIYHDYCDIGIAVSAPKGLMVPVMRNAEAMSLAQIESEVAALAGKARDSKLTIEEMTGGTFTITNGGVFGSMLSTPILNPPQSAILGMHNIVERPTAVNGKVVIRPIMFVALSYDHRIIDGRESVSFLVKVKQMLEDPAKMLFEGNEPVKVLLDI